MSSPVMSRNPYFTSAGVATKERPGAYQQDPAYGYAEYEGYPRYTQPSPEGAFTTPANSMTYDDAVVKTATLLAVTVVAGVLTGSLVPLASMLPLAIITSFAALGLGLFLSFKRIVSPATAIVYSAIEGVSLGALTFALNAFYPGVALQAVLGTIIVVAVAVGLHLSGSVRTTPKGRRLVYTVAMAAIIFSLVNALLVWTNILGGWGLRGGGLGIVIGLVLIAVAGYMLIGDLEAINVAVANNAPRNFAWTCALGIVMTILWIYVEVLRLAAIFADNR